jgi:hypothetical protein
MPAKPSIVASQGRLFTARQAAEFLGLTTVKLRRLVARRELAVIRTPEGRFEGVYEAECRAWQQRRTQPARVIETPARTQFDVDRWADSLPGADMFR